MSYRELWVFIQHLPRDSWTQTKLRDEALTELQAPELPEGPERFGPWALINDQMAVLTDAVNRVYYATGVGKFKDLEPPAPVPRPGLARAERPVRRQSEAAVLYLSKLRAPAS